MALSYLKSCYAEEEQTDSLLFQRTELQTMSEKCRESNFWQKGKAAVVNWESNAALQASLYGPCNLPQSHPFSTGHIPHQPSFEPYPTLQIFRSKRQGWLEMLTGLLAYWEESGGWEVRLLGGVSGVQTHCWGQGWEQMAGRNGRAYVASLRPLSPHLVKRRRHV